jgi:hypothetical protein
MSRLSLGFLPGAPGKRSYQLHSSLMAMTPVNQSDTTQFGNHRVDPGNLLQVTKLMNQRRY